jgi:hypothetical protein
MCFGEKIRADTSFLQCVRHTDRGEAPVPAYIERRERALATANCGCGQNNINNVRAARELGASMYSTMSSPNNSAILSRQQFSGSRTGGPFHPFWC